MWTLNSVDPIQVTPNEGSDFTVSFNFVDTDKKDQKIYTEPHVPNLDTCARLAANWLRQANLKRTQETKRFDPAEFIQAVADILNPPPPIEKAVVLNNQPPSQ